MGTATLEPVLSARPAAAPPAAAAAAAPSAEVPAALYSRYGVSKERSAEVLRLALAQMSRHPAAFNPLTFTLWYEVVLGINPALQRAVDASVASGAPLDDTAVAALYREHLAPADEDAVQRIGTDMQRLMAGMSGAASQTGARAGKFGHQLHSLARTLAETLGTKDEARLRVELASVAAGTQQMQASVEVLQEKVQTSRGEIERLRNDLERARSEALTDALTGILNRKGLDQRLEAMLAAVKSSDERHCIVMLDIDHFKRVNDTYGHLVGDRVIQGLGTVLKNSVTRSGHFAARYGGEEFALLLPNTSLDEGVAVAEAVRARLKGLRIRDRTSNEQPLSVTVSAGVAQLAPGEAVPAFVARADAALYESKRAGRDRVTRA